MYIMKRSFTWSPTASINKKRGGPSHRVRKDDGHPMISDNFEAAMVFIALAAVSGGAYFLYLLSQ